MPHGPAALRLAPAIRVGISRLGWNTGTLDMVKLDRLSGDQIELRVQSVAIGNAYGYEAMGPSVSLTGRALKTDPYLGDYDDDIGQISISVYCGKPKSTFAPVADDAPTLGYLRKAGGGELVGHITLENIILEAFYERVARAVADLQSTFTVFIRFAPKFDSEPHEPCAIFAVNWTWQVVHSSGLPLLRHSLPAPSPVVQPPSPQKHGPRGLVGFLLGWVVGR